MKAKEKKKTTKIGEIVIYRSQNKSIAVEAQLKKETIWLNLNQIADLFGRDKSVISRHIRNIFKEEELRRGSVVAFFATTASDGKTYQVEYFNLDIILSVGYRVNSKTATKFRQWATKTLSEHIIKGYTVNKQRLPQLENKQLNELEQTVSLIKKTLQTRQLSSTEERGLLQVVTDYANTWVLLQKYDESKLSLPTKTQSVKSKLNYILVNQAIQELKNNLLTKKQASDIFGREREHGLEAIIAGLEQSFGGKKLYPSVEQQAAHLLYFIIKDHPFVDGNKRIASFLFILFLARNKSLFKSNGEKKINDHALVALALLIAESEAKQKDVMVKLIMNFLV
ncbi:MAG: virulence protein RhuM/Fic/DOC family protein [bacterium]|nr:virulence protein RhuM/Fic/DOC family protein [bacterium]